MKDKKTCEDLQIKIMQNQGQKKLRSCLEEAETRNTCIAYRTHQVPEET